MFFILLLIFDGTKMDEQTLGDGTKVLIFRDSKVNNS